MVISENIVFVRGANSKPPIKRSDKQICEDCENIIDTAQQAYLAYTTIILEKLNKHNKVTVRCPTNCSWFIEGMKNKSFKENFSVSEGKIVIYENKKNYEYEFKRVDANYNSKIERK